MKSLPAVHQVKMRHSEKKLILNKSISLQKNFICLQLYLFISNLVAMTTVKILFVFFLRATVSTNFQNIGYSNYRNMVDFLHVYYMKITNDVMNSGVLHFLC